MSAEQLQVALVKLARLPDFGRASEVEALVAQLNLTEKESWQVRSLASSYYVRKFARDHRDQRFDNSVKNVLPQSVRLVGTKRLAKEVFGALFEVSVENMRVTDLSIAFPKWLLANSSRIAEMFALPPFFHDLVAYEFAEYRIRRPLANEEWTRQARGHLSPRIPLRLIQLHYDVPRFTGEAQKAEEAHVPAIPCQPAELTFCMARFPATESATTFHVRQFRIDDETYAYLDAQLHNAVEQVKVLPKSYDKLVSLGICEQKKC